ncbi:hypothetical protein H310_10619 [Aphanomyces invadans]|uniref:Secreted protein n=1 Tax=Aphanomyces invadans TaxID=157072 RepID=A0A024TPM8_9STRA|nr:hypothetical protein H310_10619 [Aphanomyces invadans]ETV95963.1 hypothetical protein H310_10619 [Aphanomyces invadans]|eukprot:XP_008875274.1 hypothetical protein H310_10619 [Aphanomyces invadans]
MCCDDICSALLCGALCGCCCAAAADEDRRYHHQYGQPVIVQTVQPVMVHQPQQYQGTMHVQQVHGQPQYVYGADGRLYLAQPVAGYPSGKV